ncbi:hypothetical protein BGZ98_005613 [Dissophora globulifera]|nr:hypothetical protein BGZ98_005613 [Dissophora globulifera]
MEAIVSLFGSNPVAIAFPESSSPSVLDLKQHLFDLYHIPVDDQRIQTAGGLPLSTGDDQDDDQVLLFEDAERKQVRYFGLSMRLGGGKGGFGSMLRAQGGRMSSQKSTNTDACRDLSGRRIKTVNDAKKMAEFVQQEPEREKARKENLKRKIEEKMEIAERPTRKHRFEDSKFFDEAEEQVEEVKSAVAAAIKDSLKSAAAGAKDIKGKGKAKDIVVEKTKSPLKSMGMWDNMSDYESSEDEEDEENRESDEDEDEKEEDSDEAKVPSVGSTSSSSKAVAVKGKGKGRRGK